VLVAGLVWALGEVELAARVAVLVVLEAGVVAVETPVEEAPLVGIVPGRTVW
jgi:hypothetical protein